MSAHLTPQARRRLDECLVGGEWWDLAAEVTDALIDLITGGGDPAPPAEDVDDAKTLIYATLRGASRSDVHTHHEGGQILRHAHPDAAVPHGYYQHPEDR